MIGTVSCQNSTKLHINKEIILIQILPSAPSSKLFRFAVVKHQRKKERLCIMLLCVIMKAGNGRASLTSKRDNVAIGLFLKNDNFLTLSSKLATSLFLGTQSIVSKLSMSVFRLVQGHVCQLYPHHLGPIKTHLKLVFKYQYW